MNDLAQASLRLSALTEMRNRNPVKNSMQEYQIMMGFTFILVKFMASSSSRK
ncbi:hypothetical protein KFK09_000800 [Dendrobium nobile]|uniref:Uncharacterized protein n=1 Tax=Dendrobium nobile TaxID=94219 RepID=A0A8T3CE33_DENNO|nr:hypothetical protein KFK09_000800 [Dendrobium nobile]